MKLIKFDLPINGTKVHDLEELRNNFTTEVLELHASGVLSKWLKSRNLTKEAEKLSAIPADLADIDKLVALCEIFSVDADREVIQAALSKAQTNHGMALHQDPEENSYREKYDKLYAALEQLKRRKLYITQDEYNRFVKDTLEIDQNGRIECFACDASTHSYLDLKRKLWKAKIFHYTQHKNIGDVVEVGDLVIEVGMKSSTTSYEGSGEIFSPFRGILMEIGDIPDAHSIYAEGDPIFYIKIDHDTDPTIKLVK